MRSLRPLAMLCATSWFATASLGFAASPPKAAPPTLPPQAPSPVGGHAVGPQYDTTHVYVAPADVDAFADSFLATFGGQSTAAVQVTVTPTPSRTSSQLLRTPVGLVSLFGFTTPIPVPFGRERTGYLVDDLDAAVDAARAAGAAVIVAPFADPIGRDAIIEWPGGVDMQLYWHFTAPKYPALASVPENRVYVSPDVADDFVQRWIGYAKGTVIADRRDAPGIEIGRPDDRYRRVRLVSGFGPMTVIVTDGRLPFPYGHESTGYEVVDLSATLDRARTAGVEVLDGPYAADGRDVALVRFPGGYIAEIHAVRRR